MSLYPIGLLIALTSFAVAIRHLNQSAGNYYDFVAILVVVGGTAAVMVALVPWNLRKDVMKAFRGLFMKSRGGYREILDDCRSFLRSGTLTESATGLAAPLHARLLREGAELWSLGFSLERVEMILSERLDQEIRRNRRVANTLRGLSKYPPAFGLIGTVLGLVNVMRGVSTGADGRQTALEMAIALVATMYGLVIANLIINPAGEIAARESQEQELHGEIAITTFRLWIEKASPLEAQETLNSFVPEEQRLGLSMPSEYEGAA